MRRFTAFLPVVGLIALLIGCSSNKSSPTASQLDQPSGLRATSPTPTSVLLGWTDNSDNEDGFKIRRTSAGQNTWADVASVGSNVTAYSDTGLIEATQYSYAVLAFKGASLSTSSDTASATTAMFAPRELSAVALSATSITLVWHDLSSVETGYKVERKLGVGRFAQIAILSANSAAMTDTGLSPSSAYAYRVAAVKGDIVSDWSNESGAMTRFPIPNAPTDLTVETLGISSLRLTWVDNSVNEHGFKIERSPIGEENWTLRAPVGSNATTYTDAGLTEGSSYRYRVYAFLENEVSDIAGPVEGVTLPAAPTELTAARLTPTSVALHWNDISATETGYTIERKVLGGEYAVAGSIAANSNSFNDASLAQNTTYIYRVRAVKGTLNSAWSNEASIQTSLLTPDPPSDFYVRGGVAYPNGAYLTWTDNSDNEIGFVIESSASRNSGWAFADSVAANESSSIVSGFPPESIRYFRMYAFNEHGQSIYTSVMSATISGIPPAPTNCVAQSTVQTPMGASITWNDNSASEDGFVIEYSANGVDGWTIVDTLAADVAGTRVNNLTVETPASFRVFSFNACGRSAYSNVATTTINGPPIAPSDLTGSAPTYWNVDLAWQDHSTAEQRFEIQRKDEGSNTWRVNGTVTENITTFSDTTVSAARTYHYQVRAMNAYGPSGYTNEVVITTPMRPPTAPTGLTHTEVDIDRIQLVWNDVSNNEDGFFIERRTQDEPNWSLLGVNSPNDAYFLDSLLTPESWYAYRVRSHNEVGYSNYSNVDSAQTLSLTLFEEDFEAMDLDQPPAGWTMNVAGSSWARVTNTRPHTGSKSLQFHDPDSGANHAWSYKSHQPLSVGTITSWLYIPHGSWFSYHGADAGFTAYTFRFMFMENDSFAVLDGGGMAVMGGFPTDRWFKIDINFSTDSSFYQVEFDDEVVTGRCAMGQVANGHVAGLAFSDQEVTDAFLDDISVERFWQPPQRGRFLHRKGYPLNEATLPPRLRELSAFPLRPNR